MKNTIDLLLSLCFIVSCNTISKSVNNPYRNAYKYIVKDLMTKKKYITVSDSLFEFDRYGAETLLKLKGHSDALLLGTSSDNNPTIDSLIHQVSIEVSNPVLFLLFSKMDNKMIMADIYDYRHFTKYKSDRFTTVRRYLFMFDNKMKISSVTSTNMQSE